MRSITNTYDTAALIAAGRKAGPKRRWLRPTTPLHRDDGTPFSLWQSSRKVPTRPVNAQWVATKADAEHSQDEAAILVQLIDELDTFDITARTWHTRYPGEPNRYTLELAHCLAHEARAFERAHRAIRSLTNTGRIIRVFHHVLEVEDGIEHVRRIQRHIPTMAASTRMLGNDRRQALLQFWIDRCNTGHVWDVGRHNTPSAIRKYVIERDEGRCQSFGRHYRSSRCSYNCALEVDHVVPILHGGSDEPANLQVLCWRCNSRKGNQAELNHTLPLLKLVAGARRYQPSRNAVSIQSPG